MIKKAASSSIIIVLLLSMFISSSAVAHESGAYAYESNVGITNTDWMAGLPDSRKLSHLSLILSHDTMTYDLVTGITESSITQRMSLQTQLESGIRAIDIRVKWNSVDRDFDCYHQAQSLFIKFDDVLDTVKTFLAEHEDETIIMHLDHEGLWNDNNKNFAEFMENVYNDSSYDELFYRGGAINPTLGDLRGKVYTIRSFDIEGDDFGHYDVDIPSVEWSDMDAELEYEYYPSGDGIEANWKDVKNHLNKTAAGSADTIYATGLNAAVIGSYPYRHASGHTYADTDGGRNLVGVLQGDGVYKDFHRDPCTTIDIEFLFVDIEWHQCTVWEEGMNDLTYEYVRDNDMTRTGILSVDFPGADLIEQSIDLNLSMANDGPVMSLGFNENLTAETVSGTITMSTPSVTYIEDRFGNSGSAFSFDGSNTMEADWRSQVFTDELTISTWFKADGNAAGARLVEFYTTGVGNSSSALMYSSENNGSISGWCYDEDSNSRGGQRYNWGSGLDDDEWHHAAYVQSDNGLKIYVDGVLVVETHPTGNAVSCANIGDPTTLEIGKYFTGGIDEVNIYNRALSASEIQGLINVPVATISFDDGSTTVYSPSYGYITPTTVANSSAAYDRYDGYEYAYSFEGAGSLWRADWSPEFTDELTISTWFKADVGAAGARLVEFYTTGVGNSSSALMYSSNKNGSISGWCYDENINSRGGQRYNWGEDLDDGKWHHAAYVHSAGGIKIYVDGEEMHATTDRCANIGDPTTLEIGKSFTGDIDDVNIYNRALSASEVRNLALISDSIPYYNCYYNNERTTDVVLLSTSRDDLIFQKDGNLVLYHEDSAVWSTGTSGDRVCFQGDGNLAVYSDLSHLWSSQTYGTGAARLVLQSDSNMCMYTSSGAYVWCTGTYAW